MLNMKDIVEICVNPEKTVCGLRQHQQRSLMLIIVATGWGRK